MATYRTFNQLNGKTLKEHDVIWFKNTRYVVYPNFIRCTNSTTNLKVLMTLGMNIESIETFLRNTYGYNPMGGLWPEFKTCDYEAITRTALAIYALIDKDPHIEFKVRARLFVTMDLKPYSIDRIVELTSDYTAHLNDTHIKVGCQKIPYKVLKEVYTKALEAGLIKA